MVVEGLEGRVVLSGGLFSGLGANSTAYQDAQQVQAAFSAFRSAYSQDYRTILYGAAADGSINPTTNRPAFDAQVGADLATLNASIARSVANLADGPTLASTFSGEILGSGVDSLQTQLKAVPTPSGVFNRTNKVFNSESAGSIAITQNAIVRQVRSDNSGSGTTHPAASVSLADVIQDLKAVKTAYNRFQLNYTYDTKNILYTRGTDLKVNTTINRPSFDVQVMHDLATLNTEVADAFSNLPANSSLLAQVQSSILGTGSGSLQGQLLALTTPSAPQTSSAHVFNFNSSTTIDASHATIAAEVMKYYLAAKTSL